MMKKNIFSFKGKKLLLRRIVGRLFFLRQSQALNNPSLWTTLKTKINQHLNERGISPPWVYSQGECLKFWSSIDNESTSKGNRPAAYATKEKGIIEILDGFWTPEVGKDKSILELGCNCGRNLYWLQQMGYIKLQGLEINEHAIQHMREVFPQLAKTILIHQGDIETVLRQMPDDSVDVIFAMGVAMHIHPQNNYLFIEMKRVARCYICTIEPEAANSDYVFARNYRRVFEHLGCFQIKSSFLRKEAFANVGTYGGCTLRLIKLEAAPSSKGSL